MSVAPYRAEHLELHSTQSGHEFIIVNSGNDLSESWTKFLHLLHPFPPENLPGIDRGAQALSYFVETMKPMQLVPILIWVIYDSSRSHLNTRELCISSGIRKRW